jgi:hypothetical protein
MALDYQDNGNLVPGIHQISWDELVNEFGFNMHRTNLIAGMQIAIADLKRAGCRKVYIDGSFVTKKLHPLDYDACWDYDGVNLYKVKIDFPLFFNFDNSRARQKYYYKGEWMPAGYIAKINPEVSYMNFFQTDRDGNKKGIISLLL